MMIKMMMMMINNVSTMDPYEKLLTSVCSVADTCIVLLRESGTEFFVEKLTQEDVIKAVVAGHFPYSF